MYRDLKFIKLKCNEKVMLLFDWWVNIKIILEGLLYRVLVCYKNKKDYYINYYIKYICCYWKCEKV